MTRAVSICWIRFLREQVYRISHWRVATEEINYRRFFDINSLGAIRVEDPAVFEQTHRLIFNLVGTGKISGLRIDHADGLQDPEDYFRRLQSGCFMRMYGKPSRVCSPRATEMRTLKQR